MNDGQAYRAELRDAYEAMAALPDDSVDLILTDPPYNIGGYSTGNIVFSTRKDLNLDIAEWDSGFDPARVLHDFRRILKPTGNLFAFCSYNLMGRWHEVFDPVFDTFQFVVWHKLNPPPHFRKTSFLKSCELIICCWNKGHNWNFLSQKEMHNFIESPKCGGRERLKDPAHPTQKPLKIMRHFVNIGSNPGDLVFDPFMGVGSSGVAALELGRRFVGSEIEPDYHRAAVARLEAASARQPLGRD